MLTKHCDMSLYLACRVSMCCDIYLVSRGIKCILVWLSNQAQLYKVMGALSWGSQRSICWVMGGTSQHPHRVLLGGPEQHRRMWRRRSPKTNLSSFGPVPAAAVAELTARAAVPKCPPFVLCSVKGLQSNHTNPNVSISTVKLFLTIYSLVL